MDAGEDEGRNCIMDFQKEKYKQQRDMMDNFL